MPDFWGRTKPPAGIQLDRARAAGLGFLLSLNERAGSRTLDQSGAAWAIAPPASGGPITWGASRYGGGLILPGTATGAVLNAPVPVNLLANQDFSFVVVGMFSAASVGNSGWLRRSTGADTFCLLNSTGNYPWLRVNAVDVLKPSTGPAIAVDTPYHLAFVWRSARDATIYVNGVSTWTATSATATAAATFTNVGAQGTAYVPGTYDKFAFYNRALSASEVASDYAAPFQVFQAPVWRRIFVPAASGVTGSAAGRLGVRGLAAGARAVTGSATGSMGLHGQSTGSAASAVARCSFTDTNGVDLNAHNAAGCSPHSSVTWARQTGSTGAAVIAANRARPGTANTRAIYYNTVASPSADTPVFADIYVASNDTSCRVGVGCRLSDSADTGYFARYEGALVGWQLFKRIAGTQTTIETVSATLTVGQSYRLEIRPTGSTLAMYVDGVQVGTNHTDTDITAAGFAGLYFIQTTPADATGYHIDNFQSATAAGVSGSAGGHLGLRGTCAGVKNVASFDVGGLGARGVSAGASARSSAVTGRIGVRGLSAGSTAGAVSGAAVGSMGMRGSCSGSKSAVSLNSGRLAPRGLQSGAKAGTSATAGSLGLRSQAAGAAAGGQRDAQGHLGLRGVCSGFGARTNAATGRVGLRGLGAASKAGSAAAVGRLGLRGASASLGSVPPITPTVLRRTITGAPLVRHTLTGVPAG